MHPEPWEPPRRRRCVLLSAILLTVCSVSAWAAASPHDPPPDGIDAWRWYTHQVRAFGQQALEGVPISVSESPAPTGEPLFASGTGADGRWNSIPPPTLWLHSAIYDPQRDRLLVFGGSDYRGATSAVWQLTLSGSPRWTRLEPAGGGPTSRSQHSAIYDPVRDRMIVFAGNDGGYRNDVWALSLSGEPVWSPLTPSGTPPIPRGLHGAIYDAANDRMVIFGGAVGLTRYDDAWALRFSPTPQWERLTPSGTPGPRAQIAPIYDAPRQRLVFFGGVDVNGAIATDTWALGLGASPAWTQIAPPSSGPSARAGSSAIYDPVRQRLVLYGGGLGAPNLNETWAFTLSGTLAWSQLQPSGPPQGRQHHTAVYDPIADRMLVYGGSNGPILGDTWTLPLSGALSWTPLSGTRRRGHTAYFDPIRYAMGVFGGDNGMPNNDYWQLALQDPPAWTKLTPAGTPPAPRAFHVADYDPVRDRLIVFGGRDASPRNDVWELSLSGTVTWRELLPTGTPPSARIDAAGIYDPVRRRLVVIGGSTGGSFVLNDVWVLSLSGTPAWTRLFPTGNAPAARGAAAIAYDSLRDRVLIYGGYDTQLNSLSDLWSLSLAGTPAWTQLLPSGTAPAARFGSSMTYDPIRDRLVLFGGTDLIQSYADTWDVSFAGTLAWRSFSLDGVLPLQRSDHELVLDPLGDRVVLYGGEGIGGSYLNDTWELRLASIVDAPASAPLAFRLGAVMPNPSRGETSIAFELARAADARVEIFDLAGRLVRSIEARGLAAGPHALRWDGRDETGAHAPAGVYFYRVGAGAEWRGGKIVRVE